MGSGQHVRRGDNVKEQERRECQGEGGYVEDTDGEIGDDYEEWLATCPKEMPSLLRRQRHALPDVSFLASREGDASESMTEDIDLGALAKMLELLPDSMLLDIPEDMCRIMGIEYVSCVEDGRAHDPFAMRCHVNTRADDEHDDGDGDSHTIRDVDSQKKNSLEDDLDALLNLGEAPGEQALAMIGQNEQEDLDAWFESL